MDQLANFKSLLAIWQATKKYFEELMYEYPHTARFYYYVVLYLLLCSSTIGKLLAIYRQFLLPPLATTIVLQGHPWQSVII